MVSEWDPQQVLGLFLDTREKARKGVYVFAKLKDTWTSKFLKKNPLLF